MVGCSSLCDTGLEFDNGASFTAQFVNQFYFRSEHGDGAAPAVELINSNLEWYVLDTGSG